MQVGIYFVELYLEREIAPLELVEKGKGHEDIAEEQKSMLKNSEYDFSPYIHIATNLEEEVLNTAQVVR